MEEKNILSILLSGDNSAKISLLQKNREFSSEPYSSKIFEALKLLCENEDIAIRFWAKKAYSSYQPALENPHFKATEHENLSIDTLFHKLRSAQSHFVANDVLNKIFNKRDISAFQPLVEFLETCSDCIVISFLVKNLCIYFPTETTLNSVVPYLKHKDDRIVANCVEGLEYIQSPKATVLINQLLAHENHRIRANAAKALANKDPETTKKVIRFMLNAKEKPHFIIAACYAIKQIKLEEFLPELVRLLNNPVFLDSSLETIVGIGSEVALGYLEAFAAEEKNKEFKSKILAGVASIKMNQNLEKASETINTALEEGQKIGKAIFGKLKAKIQAKLEETKAKIGQKPENKKATNRLNVIFEKLKTFLCQLIFSTKIAIPLIILASFFILSLSFTADGGKFTIDKNTRKASNSACYLRNDGLFYVINETSPYTGIVFSQHYNGNLECQFFCYEGNIEGMQKKWYENEQLASEESYENGKLNGLCTY